MPTKKDILLFLKAEIRKQKKDYDEAISKSRYIPTERIGAWGFIRGLEHAYKTIKGLK